MKKTLAFLLAGVMALSLAACGGNEKSESGADTTKAQSEAAQDTTQEVTREVTHEKVDVPESLIGNWNILPQEAFYRMTKLASLDGIVSLNEAEINTFTLNENGTVTVNGKVYLLMPITDGENVDYFQDNLGDFGKYEQAYTVDIESDHYVIGTNTNKDNSDYLVFQPFDNKFACYKPLYTKKKYVVKNAELTLDNWQDFWEVKSKENYSLTEDGWGDVAGFSGGGLALTPKENCVICGIDNGRIAFTTSITETSLVHINKTTEEYYYSDSFTETNESANSEQGLDMGLDSENDIPFAITISGGVSDVTDAGSEFTGRVATRANVEVTRIKGTITYLTEE